MKLTAKQLKIIALRKIAGSLLALADCAIETAFENAPMSNETDFSIEQLEKMQLQIEKEAQKYINAATKLGGEFKAYNPTFDDILNQDNQ